ncbi:endolytic transglycosylase MltG [Cellulomonas sp. URHE0023]|uniref:endolytic transglycosylase MltG n=1 Tax=Cellulomonas sp. URHE0023 TaxID=1380354 RepID=UPI0004807116|nr:endolytic transglycosylase MltG [Cellulomonas sp. URHE0023]
MATDLFGGDPRGNAPDPRRSSRSRGRAKEQRERKRRRRRSIGVLAVALVMVLGAAYVVVELMGGFFNGGSATAGSVEDYPGPGHGNVTVTVKPGDTGAQMAATLVEAGVVGSSKAFNKAFAANPAGASIQPGTYSMLLEMKASDAIVALLDPASRVSFKVTIPEGLNQAQTLAKISEKTLIPVDQLTAAIADPASIGLPAEAGGNVEGWLFPATYDVEPGSTAASVLSQMTAQTIKQLQDKGVPQDQWETVLTKASIVEREARLDEDRYKVARGIENRLERGLRLQIDSTTAYGLGVTRAPTPAENNDPGNAYSTYTHVGLPPGPISSPGAVSIDAVMHPAEGPWIFWVTVNPVTGETLFTDSSEEQNANIQKLRDWNAANGK